MYRQFQFEGDVHSSLECVPLAVRRKLDLAGLKISLKGWQTLTREERQSLCHLPIESTQELDVYRDVLRGFAARSSVALSPLSDVDPNAWRTAAVPLFVSSALTRLGYRLTDDEWLRFSEEERYCIVKYSEPKRDGAKVCALFDELGVRRVAG